VLVLALVFLVVVGLIVSALMSFASNDLLNVSHFKSQRTLQYSVGGAVEVAIQTVRYDYTPPSPTAVPCPGTNPSVSIDSSGPSISVWCSTLWAPFSSSTRDVTFFACQSSASPSAESTCLANPALQAAVTFNDLPPPPILTTADHCTIYCGSAMSVNSWAFDPVTIQQAAPTSGAVTAAASSGFTSHLNSVGGNGAITYAASYGGARPPIAVSPNGTITTSGALSTGTYTAEGTASDPNGHVGIFGFTLTVT
jgi:hypothetical protein